MTPGHASAIVGAAIVTVTLSPMLRTSDSGAVGRGEIEYRRRGFREQGRRLVIGTGVQPARPIANRAAQTAARRR